METREKLKELGLTESQIECVETIFNKSDVKIKSKVRNLTDMSDSPLEKCVMCGNDTPYKITTNINLRFNYIEGAGQLCQKCADKTYK